MQAPQIANVKYSSLVVYFGLYDSVPSFWAFGMNFVQLPEILQIGKFFSREWENFFGGPRKVESR